MKNLFPRIKQYPLSYRLLGYVLLCSSIFTLLATATQLYIEYRRDVSNLLESIDFIENSYLAPISVSVYKIDTEHLKLQLRGALNLPDVIHLEVKERRDDQVVKTAVGNLNARNLIHRDFTLSYSDASVQMKNIGTLTVTASLDGAYQRLWSRVSTVLATNAAKTFLASTGILAIIYWLITHHLTRISYYIKKLRPGIHEAPLVLNRKSSDSLKVDELDQVVMAINTFQDRSIKDVSRHKRAEEKLRQAELKYRTVADFTYDWEYWENFDGTLEYVSPSCERISGYPTQDFLDNPSLIREIIVPEDKDIWDNHFRDSRNKLKSQEILFRIQRKDGEIRWIEHACQPVTDNRNDNIGFRASNRDITKRKQAEIDLQQSYSEIKQLRNQLEAESAYLREEIKSKYDFKNIIGKSDAIKYVFFKMEQVSVQDTTVLVQGETGTGKELVARAIHNLSSRKDRPLIKVNCAALPLHLIESELFGHEKGAFTGAHTRRIGRFELADRATLFLDEIVELPLELQAKLLRVLEEGEFERIGSSHTLKVDVRIIAATNRNLEVEVQKGHFREDLWYRLKTFPITVPPLRERVDDIPLLVYAFLDTLNKKMGKTVEIIPANTMQALRDYSWPGNIRELKNVIEQAVISSSGPKLRLMDKLGTLHQDMPTPLKRLEEIERDYIVLVLEQTAWRIDGPKGAALILGLNASTLRSRMHKMDIQKPLG